MVLTCKEIEELPAEFVAMWDAVKPDDILAGEESSSSDSSSSSSSSSSSTSTSKGSAGANVEVPKPEKTFARNRLNHF
eukprot:4572995-Amphidinium_carterae.2